MKTATVILWLVPMLQLQVDMLQAGPVNMVSEDLRLSTEEEVNELELSGSGMDVEQKDEEYINSKLPKEINDMLYGGDILLTPEQKKVIAKMEKEQAKKKEGGVEKRAVVHVGSTLLWPNAVVPYVLSSALRNSAKNVINAAIAEFEKETCIDFVPRTIENDYIYFFPDNGCYSYVGRTGGRQVVSIGNGCERIGVVIHEIFHALGRWHEQSRPDRDSYIKVNTDNIRKGTEFNFAKLSFASASTNNVGYDYGSLMHYSAYAFSRNRKPTIEPLDSRVSLRDIGQRNGFSNKDLQHALNLYCGGQKQGTWSAWTQWSSCSVTCGSGSQTRTRTCQGGNCAGRSSETRVCNTYRQCPRWSLWSSWSVCSVTCGIGSQERTRTCQGGNSCVGSTRDTRICNTNVQCQRWSSWSSWSTCTVTCGMGQQQRMRSCIGIGMCSGNGIEIRSCYGTGCPGVWTDWSDWSSCSEECGAGTQTRTRDCVGGVCNGEETQERDCVKMPICRTTLRQWGPWSSWSQCSKSCGFGGTQFRTRTCSVGSCVGPNKEIRKCNVGSCPNQLGSGAGYGVWGDWRPCSRPCGGGYEIRRRRCENWPCSGRSLELRGCNYDNCPTPAPPETAIVAPSAQPFVARGHTHFSCKEINIEAGILELHTLNEDPLIRDIVQGCVDLAAASGFKFVGVTGGFCISGSNTETHYTQLPDSTSCTGGTGSFSATSLLAHMDVHRITPA